MDRSLDEFTTGDEGPHEEETDEREPVDTAASGTDAPEEHGDADSEQPSLTVGPAESTMDWTPDGATCAACGDRVERRWRDDEGLVCLGCKTW